MTPDELKEVQRVARLIAGHLSNNLTPAQERQLDEWLCENEANMLLFEKITDPENIEWARTWFAEVDIDTAKVKIDYKRRLTGTELPPSRVPVLKKWLPWAAAAAILAIVLVTAFFQRQGLPLQDSFVSSAGGRMAGTKKVLLIADGQTFDLSLAQNNQIRIGKSRIRNSNNILSYNGSGGGKPVMNTVQIPSGERYQIQLEDGTKVWLNSSSSLSYPSAFVGRTRIVQLSGEGYFEVAHDAGRPFIVKNLETNILVKGTHFNVNGYPGETKQTVSLLEGKVELTTGGHSRLLSPNQEAIVSPETIEIKSAHDISDAIAWTTGLFSFHQNSIEEVMSQVSRWYNVNISYQDNVSKEFTGQILRNSTLDQVLHMLELTGGVRFTVQENTVTVHNK